MEARASSLKHDQPSANLRDGRFSVWFSKISRALAQQMVLYARRELGLNLAEYRTLSMLAETSTASIREIAHGAELDKAQVTRAIADLNRRGLVLHSVDRHDRRLRVIKLTPKARSLISKSIPFAIERQNRLEQFLTDAELQTVWKALAILKDESQVMLEEEEQLVSVPACETADAKNLPSAKRRRV